jgi:adenine/guanine/hypoxanthine permease
MTPLTYSISHGIGYGFVAYVGIKLLRGRARDVQPAMYAAAALFVVYFSST